MKPIKRLMLSGDTVPLVDVNLILEISASGRGFITAQTEKDYSGKLVRLDIGYPERVLRWFTGFVERAQPAGKAFQRLFVREMSGIANRLKNDYSRSPDMWQRSIAGCYQNNVAWLYL